MRADLVLGSATTLVSRPSKVARSGQKMCSHAGIESLHWEQWTQWTHIGTEIN